MKFQIGQLKNMPTSTSHKLIWYCRREKLPDSMTIFCYFDIHFTLDQIYDEFMAISFIGL